MATTRGQSISPPRVIRGSSSDAVRAPPLLYEPWSQALTEEQTIGAAVAIGGVMVYSVIDDALKRLMGPGDKTKKKE